MIPDLISQFYFYLDPKSAKALSMTCQKTRAAFFSEVVQRALIRLHYHLAPSTQMSAIDHYQRLSTSKFHTVFPLAEKFTLPGPWTNGLHVSKDLTRAVSLHKGYRVINVWDLTTQTLIQRFTTPKCAVAAKLSPDGSKILIKQADKIEIWDIDTKTLLRTIQESAATNGNMTISKDGKTVLSISDRATLWDIETGECLQTIEDDENGPLHQPAPQMNAQGTQGLVAYAGGILKLWDLQTGQCLQEIATLLTNISFLSMNNGATEAIVTNGNLTKRIDLTTGQMSSFPAVNDFFDETENLEIHPFEPTFFTKLKGGALLAKTLRPSIIELISCISHQTQCLQVSDDATKLLVADQNLGFEVFYIAPLPQEVVNTVATALLTGNQPASELEQLARIIPLNKGAEASQLIEYSKNVFLPEIIELFKYSEQTALSRFELLPERIKDHVHSQGEFSIESLTTAWKTPLPTLRTGAKRLKCG